MGTQTATFPRRGSEFDNLLLKLEDFWIYFLNTLVPHGLNIDLDLKPFLSLCIELIVYSAQIPYTIEFLFLFLYTDLFL